MASSNMRAEQFWVWLAGFFDGEGCVHIRENRPNARNHQFRYSLVLMVVNTCEDVLREIHRETGQGKVYLMHGEGIYGNKKAAWGYFAHGADALAILTVVC